MLLFHVYSIFSLIDNNKSIFSACLNKAPVRVKKSATRGAYEFNDLIADPRPFWATPCWHCMRVKRICQKMQPPSAASGEIGQSQVDFVAVERA